MPLDARLAVVGSTNPAKVAAVRSALARLAPGCVILAVNVPSGASGSRGVLYDGTRTWLIRWVAALARDGRVGHASGLRMPLPDAAGPRSAPARSSR